MRLYPLLDLFGNSLFCAPCGTDRAVPSVAEAARLSVPPRHLNDYTPTVDHQHAAGTLVAIAPIPSLLCMCCLLICGGGTVVLLLGDCGA